MQFLPYVHSIAECNRSSDSYFYASFAFHETYIEVLHQN